MSREGRNSLIKITPNEIIQALQPNYGSNQQTASDPAAYQHISSNLQGSFNILPSFSKSNLDTSLYYSEDTRSNMLSPSIYNASNSSALEALRGYGPGIQSPSQLSHWKQNPQEEFCDARNSFSAGVHSPFLNQMHDTESLTSSDVTSCPPVPDLRTVDEEDEYLYGDSNSLPEAPKSVTEDPFKSNKTKSDWSDEEVYGDPSDQKSIWDVRNKKVDGTKMVRNQEEIGNTVGGMISSKEISREHSPGKKQDVMMSHRLDKQDVKNSEFVKNSQVVKSKYHVAAELLKKQTVEKNKMMNKNLPDEKIASLESHKNVPNAESKISTLADKHSRHSANEKSTARSRQLPKAFEQKSLDNIKEYIKGPQRKRPLSHEESGSESKHHRHLSPSRHHFSLDSGRSPYHDYRHRSPNYSRHRSPDNDRMRFRSPTYHSKHKSPSFEYERKAHDFVSRHSRSSHSPRKHSRDRSPEYSKYRRSPGPRKSRERSPGFHRSRERSRSPGYCASRSRSYDKYKKDTYKSHRTPEHTKKNKKSHDYSSDSFCSLSFESTSSSSTSSDESSDGKEKTTKKLSKRNIPKDEKKKEGSTKVAKKDLSISVEKSSGTQFSAEDISKSLSGIFNLPDKTTKDDASRSEEIEIGGEKFNNLVKMLEHSHFLTKMVEGVQEYSTHSSAAPVADVTVNTNTVADPQVPVMSYPQTYPYPSLSPYLAPQVNIPMMPSATFASPVPSVMPSVPSSVYGPYPPPSIPSVDCTRSAETKQIKKRPSTLRPITVSDSLSTSSVDINAKPLSQKTSLHDSPKQISEKKTKELKGKESEKNALSLSKSVTETKSGPSSALNIEKYKKMKSERSELQAKMKSSMRDMTEMRKIMDETFGKKVIPTERVIHSKCKHVLNVCSDTLDSYTKEAKRIDDDMSKFKAKLPPSLQSEVSKIKAECKEEEDVCNEYYTCYDSGEHLCFPCRDNFTNITDLIKHLQVPEHTEHLTPFDTVWKEDFKKADNQKEAEKEKCVLQAAKGIEFLNYFPGFYCSLCKEVLLDAILAEQHVKSNDHYVNYKVFIKKNPLYEKKCLFKRYIQFTVSTKQKRIKEMEVKKQQLAERKKNEDAAAERVKEQLKIEKNKEKKVEELEDEDSEDIPSSNNQKSNIKLNLTGEKEKSKSSEKPKSKECEKPTPQYIYIGKAPNYKKSQAQKPKPWYKRESILNKKEDELDISLPSPVVTSPKVTEKKLESEKIHSKSVCMSEKSNKTGKFSEVEAKKISTSYTCLTKKESKNVNDNKTVVKADKLSSEHSENCDSNSSLASSENSVSYKNSSAQSQLSGKEDTVPDDKDPSVNKAIKNILLGNDSSTDKDIPLSEIKLPEISEEDKGDSPVPMDIDNSQDPKAKPKLASEEDKDFFLLGINKDDLKPLVIPVPPPSTVLSYSSPNNTMTYLSSNVTHDTVYSGNVSHDIPHLDFSVPPPSMVQYPSNAPPILPYSNSATSMGQFPHPNTPPMAQYTNTNNLSMPPFSNPPPMHPFRNPPPIHPYMNQGNMPSHMPPYSNNMGHFPNCNNMFPNRSNSPQRPPVPLIPNQNITHNYMSQSVACDSSFTKNNAGDSKVVSVSSPSNKNKSPSFKMQGRNLIQIQPTHAQTVQTSSSVSGNLKAVPLSDTVSNADAGSEEQNTVKKAQNIEKKSTDTEKVESTKVNHHTISTSKNTEISKIVTKSNKDTQKEKIDDNAKSVTDQCEKNNVLLDPKMNDSKETDKTSDANTSSAPLDDTANSDFEQLKITNNLTSSEVSTSPASLEDTKVTNTGTSSETGASLASLDDTTNSNIKQLKVINTGTSSEVGTSSDSLDDTTNSNIEQFKVINTGTSSEVGTSSTSLDDTTNSNFEQLNITNTIDKALDSTLEDKNKGDSIAMIASENCEKQLGIHSTKTHDNIIVEKSSTDECSTSNNITEIIGNIVTEACNISSERERTTEKVETSVLEMENTEAVSLQNQSISDFVNDALVNEAGHFSESEFEKTKINDTLNENINSDVEKMEVDESPLLDNCSDFQTIGFHEMQSEKIPEDQTNEKVPEDNLNSKSCTKTFEENNIQKPTVSANINVIESDIDQSSSKLIEMKEQTNQMPFVSFSSDLSKVQLDNVQNEGSLVKLNVEKQSASHFSATHKAPSDSVQNQESSVKLNVEKQSVSHSSATQKAQLDSVQYQESSVKLNVEKQSLSHSSVTRKVQSDSVQNQGSSVKLNIEKQSASQSLANFYNPEVNNNQISVNASTSSATSQLLFKHSINSGVGMSGNYNAQTQSSCENTNVDPSLDDDDDCCVVYDNLESISRKKEDTHNKIIVTKPTTSVRKITVIKLDDDIETESDTIVPIDDVPVIKIEPDLEVGSEAVAPVAANVTEAKREHELEAINQTVSLVPNIEIKKEDKESNINTDKSNQSSVQAAIKISESCIKQENAWSNDDESVSLTTSGGGSMEEFGKCVPKTEKFQGNESTVTEVVSEITSVPDSGNTTTIHEVGSEVTSVSSDNVTTTTENASEECSAPSTGEKNPENAKENETSPKPGLGQLKNDSDTDEYENE